MSALFKPAEKPKPVSVAALLGAATKKAGKSSSHLIYKGEATKAAARWIALSRQAEETGASSGFLSRLPPDHPHSLA